MVAYGFLDRRVDGVRVIENSGGARGVKAAVSFYPVSGHAVAAYRELRSASCDGCGPRSRTVFLQW